VGLINEAPPLGSRLLRGNLKKNTTWVVPLKASNGLDISKVNTQEESYHLAMRKTLACYVKESGLIEACCAGRVDSGGSVFPDPGHHIWAISPRYMSKGQNKYFQA